MIARTFASVFPRQSPRSLIFSSIDAAADRGGFFHIQLQLLPQLATRCTRRQKKYDSPQSTPVAADQTHILRAIAY